VSSVPSVTRTQLACLRLIKKQGYAGGSFSARTINSLDSRGFLEYGGAGFYALTSPALAILEKADAKK
jgi:hypothetical protein